MSKERDSVVGPAAKADMSGAFDSNPNRTNMSEKVKKLAASNAPADPLEPLRRNGQEGQKTEGYHRNGPTHG